MDVDEATSISGAVVLEERDGLGSFFGREAGRRTPNLDYRGAKRW